MKKPGAFVDVAPRNRIYPDYVMVGSYRITKTRAGWWVYIAVNGEWEKHPEPYRTKLDAMKATQEHMGKGELARPTISLRARIARLEKRSKEQERELAELRAQVTSGA